MLTFQEKIAHLNTKGVDVYDPTNKNPHIDRTKNAEAISIDDRYHHCNLYPGFNNTSICVVEEEDGVVMKISGFTSCAALLTFQTNGAVMIGHHAALNNPLWSANILDAYKRVVGAMFREEETITVYTGLDDRFFDGTPGSTKDVRTQIITNLYDAFYGVNTKLCPLILSPEESSREEHYVYGVKFTLGGLRKNTNRHLIELMTIPYHPL